MCVPKTAFEAKPYFNTDRSVRAPQSIKGSTPPFILYQEQIKQHVHVQNGNIKVTNLRELLLSIIQTND